MSASQVHIVVYNASVYYAIISWVWAQLDTNKDLPTSYIHLSTRSKNRVKILGFAPIQCLNGCNYRLVCCVFFMSRVSGPTRACVVMLMSVNGQHQQVYSNRIWKFNRVGKAIISHDWALYRRIIMADHSSLTGCSSLHLFHRSIWKNLLYYLKSKSNIEMIT